MGLDSNGLTIRSYDDILAQLEADERANIHPDINTNDTEYLGQMNKIIALYSQNLEQILQAVVDNLDPDLAEGVWLDKLAAEKAVQRLAADYSYTKEQEFSGNTGTVVNTNVIVKSLITSNEYQVVEALTLDLTACYKASFSVSNVANSTTYTIIIDGTSYPYTSDATATAAEIMSNLATSINNDVAATWSAVHDTVNDTLTITADAVTQSLNITSDVNFATEYVSGVGEVKALIAGASVDAANTLTTLVSSVAGLASTTNLSDVTVGRDEETDSELRTRLKDATATKSVAVLDAIRSRLKNVSGVSTLLVTENTTGSTVNNIPPHAYEVVVQGGSDTDLANEIWATKPAGIATYGTTPIVISDSEGLQQTVYITRPTVVNIAYRVSYTTYNEEILSPDIDTIISDSLVSATGNLAIGEDVIPQRFMGDIFSNSSGLESITIEVQTLTNPGDAPNGGNWVTTPIAISNSQYAATSSVDVYVV